MSEVVTSSLPILLMIVVGAMVFLMKRYLAWRHQLIAGIGFAVAVVVALVATDADRAEYIITTIFIVGFLLLVWKDRP